MIQIKAETHKKEQTVNSTKAKSDTLERAIRLVLPSLDGLRKKEKR